METVIEEEKNVVQLVSGDSVRIQLEVEVFKSLQDGHGGWNDVMVNVSNIVILVINSISICMNVCISLLVAYE